MNKIIALLLIIAPLASFAQVDWENPKGAIKTQEIIIEKDKQLVLPTVSRRFTSITVDPLKIDTTSINYAPKNIQIELPKIPIKLRPRTMKTEALDQTYWGNFKVGYGSYISPYIQADVASKRNDEYAVAAHFRHFSSQRGPVDGANSALSNTNGHVSGKLFLNKATLGASLGIQRDKYHLYGYGDVDPMPEAKDIEQRLSNNTVNFSVVDNDDNEFFYYQINAGGDFFNAKSLDWSENDIHASLRVDVEALENVTIKFNGGFHVATQNSAITDKSRVFYKINPIAVYRMDAFDFEVGAAAFGTKDSINNYKSKFYLTPHLVARYSFNSGQRVSAGVVGDVTWQSARNRFGANPYLGVNTVINNEVKPIEAFIEANGKLTSKVDFRIGYKSSFYKVFGQFINNATDQSTFYIDYQEGNNVINTINGQLDFIAMKNLTFSAYGKYLMFDFENQNNAYHVPKVDVGLKARFTLENKFDVELSMAYLDGIYAYDNAISSEIQLNSIIDINVSASYKINNRFSVFVKMDNIVGNTYQYYFNYPARGFQALAGISLTL